MPATVAGLRYPYSRVLLPRTRLAYVHLRNLLTDAKRDRSARVSGYVAIWLLEELLVLYMQGGELVNACLHNGKEFCPIAISAAAGEGAERAGVRRALLPRGRGRTAQLHVCLAAERADTVAAGAAVVGSEVRCSRILMATTFDGVVEIAQEGEVNYLLFATAPRTPRTSPDHASRDTHRARKRDLRSRSSRAARCHSALG